MHYFFDGSKQNLSQKVIISELGAGVIPIVVSLLKGHGLDFGRIQFFCFYY